MKPKVKRWLERDGERTLREIGIKEGQTVLDFGCGSGIYTIPIAKIVGKTGRVYALDKNSQVLKKLMQKAKMAGLENIEKIKTSGELKIPLGGESVDVILLYDVLHSYYFSQSEREKLLVEVDRVLRPGGLVSVYPKHMSPEEIEKEVEEMGFFFEEKFYKKFLIHNNNLEKGEVLNFRKRG